MHVADVRLYSLIVRDNAEQQVSCGLVFSKTGSGGAPPLLGPLVAQSTLAGLALRPVPLARFFGKVPELLCLREVLTANCATSG